MKKLNDIDIKIEELERKQPTAHNLNLLGDLYLKKNDRKKAIAYFYKAARIYFKSDKSIAIYKKLLNIAPSEREAYEEIIDILSETGHVAEEIRYLLLLAQVYQNSGNFKKATSVFRKVNELDPTNKAADVFFSKGKVSVGDINSSEEREIKEEKEEEEEEILAIEEARTRKEEKYISMPKRKYPIILIASAIILFVMLCLSLYIGKGNKGRSPVKISHENLWTMNTKTVNSDNFKIEVTRLTDELMYKLPIASRLSQKELSENGFCFVKIKTIKGCIPEDFMKFAPRYFSLINKEGKIVKPKEFAGLDNMKKVIYKTNVCQKRSGMVFVSFYIAYLKELSLAGLFIDGLERRYPLIVKWN